MALDQVLSAQSSDELHQELKNVNALFVDNDSLYFTTKNAAENLDLWKTDGTTGETSHLASLQSADRYVSLSAWSVAEWAIANMDP